jgi:hypothetical protein
MVWILVSKRPKSDDVLQLFNQKLKFQDFDQNFENQNKFIRSFKGNRQYQHVQIPLFVNNIKVFELSFQIKNLVTELSKIQNYVVPVFKFSIKFRELEQSEMYVELRSFWNLSFQSNLLRIELDIDLTYLDETCEM